MKVSTNEKFDPVTLTLETPEELALVRAMFGALCDRIRIAFGVENTYRTFYALSQADNLQPRLTLKTLELDKE